MLVPACARDNVRTDNRSPYKPVYLTYLEYCTVSEVSKSIVFHINGMIKLGGIIETIANHGGIISHTLLRI